MTARSSVTARPGSTSSSKTGVEPASRSTRRIASIARRATSRTRPRTSTGSSPKAEEDRIIRTCKRLAAPLLGAALVLPAAPAAASVDRDAALAAYVQARVADSQGDSDLAAQRFATALSLAPDDDVLAARALAQA